MPSGASTSRWSRGPGPEGRQEAQTGVGPRGPRGAPTVLSPSEGRGDVGLWGAQVWARGPEPFQGPSARAGPRPHCPGGLRRPPGEGVGSERPGPRRFLAKALAWLLTGVGEFQGRRGHADDTAPYLFRVKFVHMALSACAVRTPARTGEAWSLGLRPEFSSFLAPKGHRPACL